MILSQQITKIKETIMYKVFDAHTHTYPESIAAKARVNLGIFYDFYCEGLGTYSHLESQAKENNVCGYLLFAVATNSHQVTKVNDGIANLVKLSRSHGFNTIGFAGMYQDYPDFETEINRAESIGLQGVKIHPDIQRVDIDSGKLYPLYEILQSKNWPLYLHMGDPRPEYQYSTPEKLLNVLRDFPKLRVVAAHLGGYGVWDHSAELLSGKENVSYDTSSSLWSPVMTPEKAKKIIHSLGYENIMFGTDYPVVNTKEELERFMAIGLSDKENEDILWNNAMRIFDIK